MAENDDLANDILLRTVRSIRAGNAIWDELLPILRRVERQLIARIEDGAPRTLTSRRARSLLNAIQDIIEGGAEEFEQGLTAFGADLSALEEDAAFRSLERRIPLDIEWERPNAQLLAATVLAQPFEGAILRDHISKWSDDVIFAMQAELRDAIVIGEGIEPIQRRLRRVADIRINDARAIARTYTHHVTSEARELLYAQNSDVIEREVWVVTLDDKLCVRCAALANQSFRVGRGPRTPLHFQCRCVRVPIVRGFPRPQIPDFPEWLREQSESTQLEILGRRRFELFQEGVNIPRFVNDENQVIPLNELRL